MGFSDIGCYGSEIQTPSLDRLAKNGIRYSQFYNAARCCPTRASLLTGVYPHQAGMGWMTYADNTLIVLVGDNGFHHGEKERWGKSILWRGACHVPLVIVAPKGDQRIAKGNCTSVVSSIDIYPILIDACNLSKIENQLSGNSLMPLLTNVNQKWDKPSISTFFPGNFVIHANQWNFIQYVDGSMELYNTTNDENEFVNLAINPEYPAISDSLSLFLPKSFVSGIQQTNEEEESLPNQGQPNRKRKGRPNNK